ncbi:2,3-dihydro-2,3-dihydroxybenzoate dehydrogenase [Solwaraspora sp. WMMD406]|uniref:2,3-dihydro-2,3-dihydroxybenzoate dehydrogenase n=1 Tax=Solwaraspora sp. WMMD406 TaxID=3016095 RepID=UPI002417E272|nr:2,3-dihydro-2,3-dihydroxybenzoate dehydrogenase [Solwaraspora sp. WMMD406]MDG4762582.1 2,3-dihydro-2,3-dihydroxybenzoate dehydrogenase [Solwaraspora sp. WMMD406]
MGQLLAGVVAVVTGAAGGIGAAIGRALTAEGAAVAAVDRDRSGLAAVTGWYGATPYPVDVVDPDAVDDAIERIEAGLGPVGVLVNAAGVLVPGAATAISDRDWHDTFAVNATGVFHMCRAVVARMRPRRHGAVVTVASNAAGVPRTGMAAYAASKAAAVAYTMCLGLEVARDGIRCNVISPGSTDTQMLHQLWTDGTGPRETVDGRPDQFRTGIPLGRIGTPDDVAEAVVFLASARARQITLQNLYVDGGAALRM